MSRHYKNMKWKKNSIKCNTSIYQFRDPMLYGGTTMTIRSCEGFLLLLLNIQELEALYFSWNDINK